jgi:hypothetical protein
LESEPPRPLNLVSRQALREIALPPATWRDLLWLNYLRADKRVLFGPDYRELEVTAATLAEEKRRKRRDLALGIIVLAAVVAIAVLYGSEGTRRCVAPKGFFDRRRPGDLTNLRRFSRPWRG